MLVEEGIGTFSMIDTRASRLFEDLVVSGEWLSESFHGAQEPDMISPAVTVTLIKLSKSPLSFKIMDPHHNLVRKTHEICLIDACSS